MRIATIRDFSNLLVIFSCLCVGYYAGAAPLRMFKADGISCTFKFPSVELNQPLNGASHDQRE